MNNNFEKLNDILKEINNLKRQIKIKDAYLQLIRDIAFDYDGYGDSIEGLRDLVDELSAYAKMAIENDDQSSIYSSWSDGVETESNILMEDLEK